MIALQINFTEFWIIVNTLLRGAMGIYFFAFVIPLVIKEAKVKNGLRDLRIEMLATTSIVFAVGIDGLLIILLRYFGFNVDDITIFVTFLNSLLLLVYMMIKHRIYTKKYTPENKKLHERIEKMEQKEQKRVEAKKKKAKVV